MAEGWGGVGFGEGARLRAGRRTGDRRCAGRRRMHSAGRRRPVRRGPAPTGPGWLPAPAQYHHNPAAHPITRHAPTAAARAVGGARHFVPASPGGGRPARWRRGLGLSMRRRGGARRGAGRVGVRISRGRGGRGRAWAGQPASAPRHPLPPPAPSTLIAVAASQSYRWTPPPPPQPTHPSSAGSLAAAPSSSTAARSPSAWPAVPPPCQLARPWGHETSWRGPGRSMGPCLGSGASLPCAKTASFTRAGFGVGKASDRLSAGRAPH